MKKHPAGITFEVKVIAASSDHSYHSISSIIRRAKNRAVRIMRIRLIYHQINLEPQVRHFVSFKREALSQ